MTKTAIKYVLAGFAAYCTGGPGAVPAMADTEVGPPALREADFMYDTAVEMGKAKGARR